MPRRWVLIGSAVLCSGIGLVLLVPMIAIILMSAAAYNACNPGSNIGDVVDANYSGPGVGGLNADQTKHAASVISVGRQMKIPDRGIVVALAVVSQESGFKVYANDGQGGDLQGDQRGIQRSLQMPHEALGTDHGSLGLFQQQWPWWGTMQELMDPASSAKKFYAKLKQVRGWESMPVTVAAQSVQRSATPTAYADDEALARQLVAKLGNAAAGGTGDSGNGDTAVQPVAATGNGPGSANVGGPARDYHLGAVKPQLKALVAVLAPKFAVKTVGGYRASATDPGGHPSGLAADFMTSGKAQGDQIAAYARAHAGDLGVDYVIWRQRIWSVARAGEGWRAMADRGGVTENHFDHVHINVKPGANAATISTTATGEDGNIEASGDCASAAAAPTGAGTIHWPLKPGSFTDQRNWHDSSSLRSSWHTGTDLSAPCGTPVMAVNSGKVIIRTDQSWAGPNLVQVQSGPGQLTTWYGHMRQVDVKDGQTVTAGDGLGQVGDLGNSTGCHLHLEVHTKGGSIYGPDNTNPSTWLAANVGKNLGGPAVVPAIAAGKSASDSSGGFRLVTLNTLGDSHTGGRGKDPGWPSGPARVPGMVKTLNRWGADVAGLQEVQPRQRRAIAAAVGNSYQMYPRAGSGGDNRVLWRTDTFTLVRATTLRIPYFNGHMTPMPAVLLRQKATGKTAWFVSIHNPADTRKYHRQGGYRARAIAAERRWARVAARQAPVFIVGDFNDRRGAFCSMTASNLFRSASGGRGAPRCQPPAGAGGKQIDWIFAAGGSSFSGYQVDRSPVAARIADHPIVISQATIG